MNCRFPFNCIANICNKIYTLQYKVPLFYDKYRKNRKKRRQCNDCQRFFIQIIFRSSELISRHSDRCTIRPVTISELGSGLFPLAAHQLQRHRNGLHAVALAAALEAHVIRIAHLLERPETVHVIVDGSVLAGRTGRPPSRKGLRKSCARNRPCTSRLRSSHRGRSTRRRPPDADRKPPCDSTARE